MFVRSKLADFFIRTGLGLLLGVAFGWVLSEFSFQYLGIVRVQETAVVNVLPRIAKANDLHGRAGLVLGAIPGL